MLKLFFLSLTACAAVEVRKADTAIDSVQGGQFVQTKPGFRLAAGTASLATLGVAVNEMGNFASSLGLSEGVTALTAFNIMVNRLRADSKATLVATHAPITVFRMEQNARTDCKFTILDDDSDELNVLGECQPLIDEFVTAIQPANLTVLFVTGTDEVLITIDSKLKITCGRCTIGQDPIFSSVFGGQACPPCVGSKVEPPIDFHVFVKRAIWLNSVNQSRPGALDYLNETYTTQSNINNATRSEIASFVMNLTNTSSVFVDVERVLRRTPTNSSGTPRLGFVINRELLFLEEYFSEFPVNATNRVYVEFENRLNTKSADEKLNNLPQPAVDISFNVTRSEDSQFALRDLQLIGAETRGQTGDDAFLVISKDTTQYTGLTFARVIQHICDGISARQLLTKSDDTRDILYGNMIRTIECPE